MICQEKSTKMTKKVKKNLKIGRKSDVFYGIID